MPEITPYQIGDLIVRKGHLQELVYRITDIETGNREPVYVCKAIAETLEDRLFRRYHSEVQKLAGPLDTRYIKEPNLSVRRTRLLTQLNRLLEICSESSSDDYEIVRKFQSMLRYGYDFEGPAWFCTTIAESLDCPNQLSWAPSIETVDNDIRRRHGRCGTLFNHIKKYHRTTLTDVEINRLGYLVGSHFLNSWNYGFEIVSGDQIIDAYLHGPESCMVGQPQLRLYASNPDKVSLLKISQDNKYIGRALLWNTDDGTRVLDRIYPSDGGPHIGAAHTFAEKEGWDWKLRQDYMDGGFKSKRMDYTVTLSLTNKPWTREAGFPYMDTFKYADDVDGNKLTLLLTEDRIKFELTNGGYTEDGESNEPVHICENCEEEYEEEPIYITSEQINICGDCYDNYFTSIEYRHTAGAYISEAIRTEDTTV